MERAKEEQFPHIFSISLCILVIMPFRIFWDAISPYNQSRYVKNEYDPIFSQIYIVKPQRLFVLLNGGWSSFHMEEILSFISNA